MYNLQCNDNDVLRSVVHTVSHSPTAAKQLHLPHTYSNRLARLLTFICWYRKPFRPDHTFREHAPHTHTHTHTHTPKNTVLWRIQSRPREKSVHSSRQVTEWTLPPPFFFFLFRPLPEPVSDPRDDIILVYYCHLADWRDSAAPFITNIGDHVLRVLFTYFIVVWFVR